MAKKKKKDKKNWKDRLLKMFSYADHVWKQEI